jgi:hypothetical protein
MLKLEEHKISTRNTFDLGTHINPKQWISNNMKLHNGQLHQWPLGLNKECKWRFGCTSCIPLLLTIVAHPYVWVLSTSIGRISQKILCTNLHTFEWTTCETHAYGKCIILVIWIKYGLPWHCTNNTKGVVDACYKWPKSYQTFMLLELVNRPKKLGGSEKHLERTCKGLDIKINYNKT